MERYEPGGYHPVQIGDRLHDRYRVLYKLGHGAYSTTWLARDQQSSKLVAVKVGTADISPEEADMVSRLHTAVEATDLSRSAASSLFAPVVEKFEIHGPNGRHHCYTKFPARASLSDVKDALYTLLFQPDVARALVAQLALAMAIFHAQGYVHGGVFPLQGS
jgi:serine/threonine-protein kinase SRPK3